MSEAVLAAPQGVRPPKPLVPLKVSKASEIETIMKRYPVRRSGVMSVLYLAQERDGWITEEAMLEVAEICEMTPAEVLEMVSFYTMYHTEPVGKYVLWVCGTLPCALCGSDGLIDYFKEKLGIGVDGVTEDGMFTIKRAECLGACSEAPLMLVNEKMEIRLNRGKVDEIISQCRAGSYKGVGHSMHTSAKAEDAVHDEPKIAAAEETVKKKSRGKKL